MGPAMNSAVRSPRTHLRTRGPVALLAAAALVVGTVTPAVAEPGDLTCEPLSIITTMDTAVTGQVVCAAQDGLPIAYQVVPYVLDANGPFNGKLSFDVATGGFVYTPGFYPPDPLNNGKQDRLPEFVGPDSFDVVASTDDGDSVGVRVEIDIQAPAPATVSGVVFDGAGGHATGGQVIANPTSGRASTVEAIAADGTYSLELLPGEYALSFRGDSPRVDHFTLDTAPRLFLEDTPLDIAPDLRPLTARLEDADGQPVSGTVGTSCSVSSPEGAEVRYLQSSDQATGSGDLTLWVPPTPPGVTCQIWAEPDGSARMIREVAVSATEPNAVAFTLPRQVTISGTLADGVGGELSSGFIGVYDRSTNLNVDTRNIGPDGAFSFSLPEGRYSFEYSGHSSLIDRFYVGTDTFDVPQDTAFEFAPLVRAVSLRVVDASGALLAGRVAYECAAYPDASGIHYESTQLDRTGSGEFQIVLPQGPAGSTCQVSFTPGFGTPEEAPEISVPVGVDTDDPTAVTLIAGAEPAVVPDSALATEDGDGVAALLEAQVPSLTGSGTGDGNGDGTYDSEQVHVSSLPAFGRTGVEAGTSYLTLAAPTGTALVDVQTLDPTDPAQVSTPAPEGLSLPDGLASFTLVGVEPGSSQTISIYSASAGSATGYAKYDANSGAWTLLPADRVALLDDHIEITLTDGGVGDADGLTNGEIVDPGGPVEVTDVTPPTASITAPVVGASVDLDGTLLTDFSCTDTDAGFGVAAPLTCVGEVLPGGDPGAPSLATVTSGQPLPTSSAGSFLFRVTATDGAGNSATDSITYTVTAPPPPPDTTNPTVSISSPLDGDQIRQGASATAGYSCADEGGSLLASCEGTVARLHGPGGGCRPRERHRHVHPGHVRHDRHGNRRRWELRLRVGDLHRDRGHRPCGDHPNPCQRRAGPPGHRTHRRLRVHRRGRLRPGLVRRAGRGGSCSRHIDPGDVHVHRGRHRRGREHLVGRCHLHRLRHAAGHDPSDDLHRVAQRRSQRAGRDDPARRVGVPGRRGRRSSRPAKGPLIEPGSAEPPSHPATRSTRARPATTSSR